VSQRSAVDHEDKDVDNNEELVEAEGDEDEHDDIDLTGASGLSRQRDGSHHEGCVLLWAKNPITDLHIGPHVTHRKSLSTGRCNIDMTNDDIDLTGALEMLPIPCTISCAPGVPAILLVNPPTEIPAAGDEAEPGSAVT